jgi:hypothetical protein
MPFRADMVGRNIFEERAMPLIMKSSDNGFVDAINKTVRFPGRERARRDFEEAARTTISTCPLGGWSTSSWSANADVVHLTDARTDNLGSPSGGEQLHRVTAGGLGDWTVIVSDSSPPVPLGIDRFQYSPFALSAAGSESGAMVDPGEGADVVDVAYFPELGCYRSEVLATCEAATFVEINCGDTPDLAKKSPRRRRFAA